MVIIRKATDNDVENIRHMHAESWLETYPSKEFGVTLKWLKDVTARWLTPEGIKASHEHFSAIFGDDTQFYRVAENDGSIVGFIHAAKKDDYNQLEVLYVVKDQQGTGLADNMIQQALAWMGDDRDIALGVATYNERAKAFYRKFDFKEIPNSTEYVKNKIPTVRMVKRAEGI